MDLDKHLLFKAIIGSQAYGTTRPDSDIDYKGVFIMPFDDFIVSNKIENYDVNKDERYWGISKFIELLSESNPTALELLHVPDDCIVYKHPLFDDILKYKDKFITTKCADSFGKYGASQIRKAKGTDKKINWEKNDMVRKSPLDFCYVLSEFGDTNHTIKLNDYLSQNNMVQENVGLSKVSNFNMYAMYYSNSIPYRGVIKENGNDIRLSSIPKGEKLISYVSYGKADYVKHCHRYKEWLKWLEDRNEARYADVEKHGQKFDGKNLSHCIRILRMAEEIAKGEGIIVRRPDALELLDIRTGKVKFETLLENAENIVNSLDKLYAESNLPDAVDSTLVKFLLTKIRKEFYQI